ncbi:MAG: RNA polymerase sigma factor [Marinifilaceae bacterium]
MITEVMIVECDLEELEEREITPNDEKLVAFFTEHYEQLCVYAYRMVQNFDEAEDLVQSLFTRMLDEKRPIQIGSLRSYAYKAIYNSAINHLTQNERNRKETENYSTHIQELLEITDGEPYVYKTLARNAMEKVPEKSRDLLILHCIKKMKYNEIAVLRGISINTVKSQLRVAYRILEGELGNVFSMK